MAVVCTGCLAACGGKSSNPIPALQPAPPAGSGNLFTVDLNSNLLHIGDSSVTDGVILVRLANGNVASAFTAVQVACTHQGASIGYNNNEGIFICPLHGSEFSKTGQVVQGPATTALQKYNVAVNDTTLTVSA